jgi:pyridoxamine 5'-phosphate oxidase
MSLRDRLRAVPSVTGTAPAFDTDAAPDDPRALLLAWLDEAIESSVREPLAVTLATVDETGAPDARVLMLKNVTADGAWEVATTAESAKSRHLDRDPRAALSVYWREQARAVRMQGRAHRASAADAAADFLARSPRSRALVIGGRQGEPVGDPAEHAARIAEAEDRIARDPGLVAENWVVWRITPIAYEFWQGDLGREHLRVRYDDGADGWSHRRLQG